MAFYCAMLSEITSSPGRVTKAIKKVGFQLSEDGRGVEFGYNFPVCCET